MQNQNIYSLLLIFCIIIFTDVQVTSASGDWAGEAKELMNSGEYDKALDVINAALSSGESKDLCYVQRANVYKKMGEYQKAIDDYDKAISLNPAMPYYLAMKGDVYILMGEYQKGIDLYDSALQKNIGYEPLVQSVKSSREEAYQKMKDATDKTELSQIPVSETPTIAQLETGSLSLVTVPQGAQVTLDGIIQDEVTPLTLNDIDVGSHSITFSKSGYLDVAMTVPVIQGETSEFSISLSPESHEISSTSGNNEEKTESRKESQGEDLIVGEIALVYYKPDSNDLSTDLAIDNIGTASAARFAITYFLSPEQISEPFMDPEGKEIILGRDEINTLGAIESRKSSTMKTFSLFGVLPGKYWFGVFVDSQNSIAETDEGNNVRYWEEQIQVKGLEQNTGPVKVSYPPVVTIIPTVIITQMVTPSPVVTQIPEKSAWSWEHEGKDFFEKGQYEEAINAYEQALKIDPQSDVAWNGKGSALNYLGRYEEAIKALDQALKIDPDLKWAWNNKGFSFEKLGRYEEAIQAYERALKFDPEYKTAKDNLERILKKTK